MKASNTHARRREWRATPAALVCAALTTSILAATEVDVRRDASVEAVERVMPCVVNIQTQTIVESRDPFEDLFREFWGPYYRRRRPDTQYSLGSGVIIDEDGYVLTNLHVVRRADEVWVQLSDGRQFRAERIIGNTRVDVALLKLITKGNEKFKAVKFAKDDDLLLGETVLALGNPFGLGGSVSRGILSSKNRRPRMEDEPLDVADWLQTDAAINPGSSGGPLINLRGELIGLNVAIYREGQGIGFAIPVRQVSEALSEIFTPETMKSLWFGARIKAGPYPLMITSVEAGSPAEKAGLQKGDVISQVNGRTPKDFVECTTLLGARDHEVILTVHRNGERRKVTAHMTPLADVVRERLGVTAQELTRELADNFGYNPRAGLLIAGVDPGSPAARADLRPGDLIAGVDGQATPDLISAAGALASKKHGERAQIGIVVRRSSVFGQVINQGSVTVRVR